MSPGSFQRVRAILDDLLETEHAERESRLGQLCGDDAKLRRNVRSLLRAEARCVDGFLSAPGADEVEIVWEELEAREWVGRRVGAYRIDELLAVGGMGSVFRAERVDGLYEHVAAIKVINGGVESPRLRRRFHAERQALAALEHPHIARLLDGGATADGRPYLVMELVEGETIDRYCDRRRLDVRARLRIVRTVCEAVHYAHQKLIVHRDLKPANILVTADGRPKLVDFGVARLLHAPGRAGAVTMTATGSAAMTPQYASPEQIRGETTTTAADVYSLGVILYELLTGHRPFASRSPVRYELERRICEVDPARPSAAVDGHGAAEVAARRRETPRSLRQRLRGDLDVIITTALDKDPHRRYGSVRELSDDLGRCLAALPVAARGDTVRYRAGRFVRRHRGAVAAVLAVAVTLTVGLAGTSLGLVRARAERASALEAKASAEAVTVFLRDLLADASPYRHGENVTILEMLEGASARIESELAGRPEVEAGVRAAVGRTYLNLWHPDDAAPHLQRAVELYERQAPASVDLADALSALGRALTFASDARAVRIQQRALAIRSAAFGADSAPAAESTGNLAYALWHAQTPPDWTRADSLYRRAIGMYEAIGLGSCRDAARFTFSRAVMLAKLDRLDESVERFARSLAVYESLPNGDDRYMVECMIKYAGVLERLGRFDEAAALLDRATEMTPPELMRVGLFSVTWRRASVRRGQERLDDAVRLYGRALADEAERHLGRGCGDDPGPGSLPARLRRADVRTGDLARAFALLRRDGCVPALALLRPMEEVADLCCRRGDWPVAVTLLEDLTALHERTFPAGHEARRRVQQWLQDCRARLAEEA